MDATKLPAIVAALLLGAAGFAAGLKFGAASAPAPAPLAKPKEDEEKSVTSDNDDGDDEEAFSEDDEGSDEDSSVVPPDVELKMVIAVRDDLGMSKGKIAAQVGHGVLAAWQAATRNRKALTYEWAKAWNYRAAAKIALRCTDEAQLLAVAEAAVAAGLPVAVIEDAGRTEVEPGTRTVCAIGPAPKAVIDKITGPKGSHALRLLS